MPRCVGLFPADLQRSEWCSNGIRRYALYRRADATAELQALLADPDASLAQTTSRLLKAGRTCTVWLTVVAGRALVVKRYNYPASWRHWLRFWRPSRALVSWENAHRLLHYGIATAPPVALIEERQNWQRRAYFITDWVEGEDGRCFFAGQYAGTAIEQQAVQALADLFTRLAAHRISHGDMKSTNVILTTQGPVLIDLDALHEHRCYWLFRRRQRRDLHRFLANWRHDAQVHTLLTTALSSLRRDS